MFICTEDGLSHSSSYISRCVTLKFNVLALACRSIRKVAVLNQERGLTNSDHGWQTVRSGCSSSVGDIHSVPCILICWNETFIQKTARILLMCYRALVRDAHPLLHNISIATGSFLASIWKRYKMATRGRTNSKPKSYFTFWCVRRHPPPPSHTSEQRYVSLETVKLSANSILCSSMNIPLFRVRNHFKRCNHYVDLVRVLVPDRAIVYSRVDSTARRDGLLASKLLDRVSALTFA